MKALMIGLMAWGIAGAAQAQDWVPSAWGETTVQLYDQDGIRVQGNLRSAWIVVAHAATRTDDLGNRYDWVMTRMTFDCDQGRSRYDAQLAYRFGTDLPVSNEQGVDQWRFWTPGTLGEATAEAICAGERQESAGVKVPREAAFIGRQALLGE